MHGGRQSRPARVKGRSTDAGRSGIQQGLETRHCRGHLVDWGGNSSPPTLGTAELVDPSRVQLDPDVSRMLPAMVMLHMPSASTCAVELNSEVMSDDAA